MTRQLSVFVENKTGRLAEITSALAEAQIDIRAVSVADTNDFGILRLILSDPDKGQAILKEHGFTVSLTQVLTICIGDAPGGLAQPMKLLSDSGIGVEYMYAFLTKTADEAYVILRVSDNAQAEKVLTENNIRLVPEEKIREM